MSDLMMFAQSNTAARIRAAATRGALPHALIFSGGGEGAGAADRVAAAGYAAAAFECVSPGERPCLTCSHCRKVMAGIHPDVQFVRDPEHKELSAETVRAMRSDAFIRPTEGERKVYIFEDCAALNERDQNILLKTVEEGPPYCAFLFCTGNAAALLETIRSRCVECKLPGGGGGADGGQAAGREKALELCRRIAKGNAASRASFFGGIENEKLSRDELAVLLEDARLVLAEALRALYGAPGAPEDAEIVSILAGRLTKARILGTIELLDAYRRRFRYNVGVGMALGGLAAELEEVLK